MTINEIPYFMTNENWYYYDEEKFMYILTDKATPKAIESYKKFYAIFEKVVKDEL